MKTLYFLLSVFVMLLFFHPMMGALIFGQKPDYSEVLQGLDLNELCGGTEKCMPAEIAEQEHEEQWIIQKM